jgi:effector-binding domain-containing protein
MGYSIAFINGKLDKLSSILEKINRWLDDKKIEPISPPIGIVESGFFEKDSIVNIKRKIGVAFEGYVEGEDEIKVDKIQVPNFENTAVALHKGSYKTLDKTYKLVFDYLSRNEYKFKPPYREIYFLGGSKDRMEDLLVEIQIPLVEKSIN